MKMLGAMLFVALASSSSTIALANGVQDSRGSPGQPGVGVQAEPAADDSAETAANQAESSQTQPPLSQPPQAGPTEGLGDIIVTAQRRKQRLQDVGVSVTSLNAQDVLAIGKADALGLAIKVPNLQINQYSPSITVFNIRGVSQNDFSDSQEAPIAFYNDGVYISSLGAIAGQMYDLENVEVLRGPQGTLFGRNSTGGLTQITTAKPTDYLDGYVTATFGSYGQFAPEAAIGGPLSDDVRGRLSFTVNRQGPFTKNLIGKDGGNARFYAGRVQLQADLPTGGNVLVKAYGMRNDHEVPQNYENHTLVPDRQGLGTVSVGDDWGAGIGANPFGYIYPTKPRTGSYNQIGDFNRTYYGSTVTISQPIGSAEITSITDFQRLKKDYIEDTDGSPDPIFNYNTHQRLKQFSQELRLSGKAGALTYTAGLYYIHIDTRNRYNYTLNFDGSTLENAGFSQIANYGGRLRTDSAAVFAQVEYALNDKLKVIGGIRYTKDWKKFDYSGKFTTLSGEPIAALVANPGNGYADLLERSFGDYSGKLELDFKPSKDSLIYASINRGIKSGGFNTLGALSYDANGNAFIDASRFNFGGEVLTNYEGGFKIQTLDNKLRLNGAAFHYKYGGYQAFYNQNLINFISNSRAKLTGAEVEMTVLPTRGLQFTAFGSYLHTRVYGIVLPNGSVVNRRLPQAPKWSFGGSASYAWTVLDGKATASTDWRYDGPYNFTTFNPPFGDEPRRAVGNVRLQFSPAASNLSFAFFVQNVTDKRYRVYVQDSSSLSFSNELYARPRWFGGSVTYNIK